MSFFTKIRDKAGEAWHSVTTALTPVEHKVMDLASNGLHVIGAVLKEDGIDAVRAAVFAAETTGGTGPEKFLAAKKALENSLKGANITDSVINLAIELAVQALKAAVA